MEHIQSEGTCPARGSATTLIIAGHVLPLACVDDFNVDGDCVVEGVERMLAPPPLLANLGKASADAYNFVGRYLQWFRSRDYGFVS